MIQNIDIKGIITMMKMVPKKYDTTVIKIARGKFDRPTTLTGHIKKLING